MSKGDLDRAILQLNTMVLTFCAFRKGEGQFGEERALWTQISPHGHGQENLSQIVPAEGLTG